MAGAVCVWDLRRQKDVVVPGGLEKIGNYWFWGSEIESVTVPGSVREIGTEAFCNCKNLGRVVFAEDSVLERVEARCFSGSGIKELTLPNTLKRIGNDSFRGCSSLKALHVEDRCEAVLFWAGIPDSVQVAPLSATLVGGVSI